MLEAITNRKKNKIKPFKLRRPVVVGFRPGALTTPWRAWVVFTLPWVWFVFCTTVIIVAGIVGWFYPWFGLAALHIVIVMLFSSTCLHCYLSRRG